MSEFRMPALGADMESGILAEWHVQPGERVERGQVVCVVETQKGAIEVEIWESGTVARLVAAPGDRVPVGEVLAVLRNEGDTADEATSPPPSAEPPVAEPRRPPGSPAARATSERPRRRVSPAARRRAAALGVDPAHVTGSGPGGTITLEDIEQAAATPGATAATDDRAAMRRAIAAAMSRANREIPHYYLGNWLCVEPALAWLATHNARRPVAERLIFPVLQLRAVALALHEVPDLNGWYLDGAFRAAPGIHLGVAIALRGGGLVAPALHDADTQSPDAMMAALHDLLSRARAGQLRSSELADSGLTVTNLGDLGVDSVQGVITPPQVALVGFGRVSERPWVRDGQVVAARCVHASLAADHRVTDGAVGARFLARMTDLLQEPERLWLS